MAVQQTTIIATATGGAGVAQGSRPSAHRIHGSILDVYLNRSAVPQATTRAIVREATHNPPITVLDIDGLTTDQWWAPTKTLHESDGTERIGPTDYYVVNDFMELVLDTADNGSVVEATIRWEDGIPNDNVIR